MPKTRVNCPNCRQPVVVELNQLFDVGVDPSLKQRFLSGSFNLIQCPNCGYQGNMATPIVYHDPNKELLLTYIPPELGLPRDEQERLLGNLINQVVNHLAPEQRKAYIFRPQANLTLQNMIERVLEGEGITREMLQEQQKRLNVIQRLLEASDADVRAEIIKQESALIDSDFFALFGRLVETASTSGDQAAFNQMQTIQSELLEKTSYGQDIKEQAEEVQAAIQALQKEGQNLTREKLLDIVIKAPNDTRVSALVSLARHGMDYQFFQLLSERIDRARDKGRQRLIELRERLLELTRQFDEQVETRRQEARALLDQVLESENPGEAVMQVLPVIDEFFIQLLEQDLEKVRGSGDLEKLSKLQQVMNVIQQATAPPPEVSFIEELLDAPDEQARRRLLEEQREKVTPELVSMISNFLAQAQQSNQEPALIDRLKTVSRQVRRFSMESNLKG